MRDWRDGVVYQIYPRSYQDTDGDGVGDLNGIRSRLDHLEWLGVDAIWLSPIYPSPLADFGYDVSDYERVDPVFGTLDDFTALADDARSRGIRLLLDFVPCHTSIEHPWFCEHPDWYVWRDGRGDGPPNNWKAAFGGPAWTYSPERGRWYMHSFYPEQPDLDWRNPDVVAAMQGVLRHWLERGADGYRIDAIDRLMEDPEFRDDPPRTEPFPLPLRADEAQNDFVHSRNGPGTAEALAKIREAVGDAFLVAEVYLPSTDVGPYLDHFDRFFVFELMFAAWEAEALRAAIATATAAAVREHTGPAWVMSNHDFGRLASRHGHRNARAALMLLLTLPGTTFLYQGDELALRDGEGHPEVEYDRAGRDRYRHPMQWEPNAGGGFTSGEPWLPVVNPHSCNVAEQRADPGSPLHLCRDLIALRKRLGAGFELLDGMAPGVLAYTRGAHVVVINTGTDAASVPADGEPVLATSDGALRNGRLAPHAGVVTRQD